MPTQPRRISRRHGAALHAPWESRHPVAGYPEPIVDHGLARELALAAYAEIKKETQ
jgi:deoxyribodipyrimidine photolyase